MMHSAKPYDGKIAGLYDLEETLGSGHFAVVKLARHVFTGEKVAVKVIDKTRLDEVSRSHLFQEVRCMKLVQHPNVVRLYEVIDTQTKLYLILELGDGGDLYDYIMKHEGGLGEDAAREYFRQIVRAISYCHQLHVVHRDLKPENVVFFERLGVVKLTDFGFSNKFCPGQKLETSCGSLAYCAPEILLGDSYDAPAVDVWSLGVILYMLVVGQAPFREANDSETLTMIMDCKYSVPNHVSDTCQKLISRMLVREPESRATLEDIATDTWLGGGPEDEYLSLVGHQQLSEEERNIIINKMVAGTIATKEEILDALEKNDYNHVTATYFLLAERKLRAHRQEEARARGGPLAPIPQSMSSHSFNTSAESGKDGGKSVVTELVVPEATQGRVRKCSIVQEEEDEEEYRSQELTPAHSNFSRRGSRSEGKLNVAIQERIADERRALQDGSCSTHPLVPVTRVDVRDDSGCWSARRSPTTSHSGASKWRSARQKSQSDSDESSSHVTDVAITTLSEAATISLPLTSSVTPVVTPELTRFRTLPSPTRAARLNEISEEGVPDFAPRLSLYEQRRNKFHKSRTASCSSSDASDDDSESRKKRAAKISSERARRDSHDDSSDSQDPGANGGGGAGGTSGGGESGGCGERGQQPPPRPQPPPGGTPPPPSGGRPHRARRRAPDTRLRESQSLNRITEVQEPMGDPVLERLVQDAKESKPGKGLGARLQSWARRHPHWLKTPDEEKENRGKKMKLLGRYFQVSKKLCIPLPSLMSKGRLYKARSCGTIARDRVVTDPVARPSDPGTDNYVHLKRLKSPPCGKGKGGKGSSEVVLSAIADPVRSNGKVVSESMQCPRKGVCTKHMQDAAKCHLS